MEIRYFNRSLKEEESELVYGASWAQWLYRSAVGRAIGRLVTGPLFSQIFGKWQDLGFSARKIPQFVQRFNINLSEFMPEESGSRARPYSTFNSFFIRRFTETARSFPEVEGQMGAFCEARYLGYESSTSSKQFPLKGELISLPTLLQNERHQKTFIGGPLLIARLCPADYHRFHFPDQGEKMDRYPIPGDLHSVNPVALKWKSDILTTNERRVTILDTKNFGQLAYVEVGAICVGKIIESHQGKSFSRGQEKGYFLFGGSTVIVVGEPGRWKPADDILHYSKQGMETLIKLGDPVANGLVGQGPKDRL